MADEPEIRDIKHLIFDFDTFIYRCGFAVEKKKYHLEAPTIWGHLIFDSKKELNAWLAQNSEYLRDDDDILISVEHIVEPVENALQVLKQACNAVINRFPGVTYEGYLSDGPGFRAKIAVTRVYKGNRDLKHKPTHYGELRRYCVERLNGTIVSEIEADDAASIALFREPAKHCVISNDKDLRQVPGWHYDWTKPEIAPTWVRPKDALLKFYEQLIAGDPTDNVVGIPGVGPVGARECLDGVGSPEDAERRAWERYKKDYPVPDGVERLQFLRDRFLENGRLVRILRRQGEELWEPDIELT